MISKITIEVKIDKKRPMHLTKNKQFSALEKKKQFRKKIVDFEFRISC